MPVMGSSCMQSSTLGMHGTYPAGGENIGVFIIARELGFRVVIMTSEVVITIDVP